MAEPATATPKAAEVIAKQAEHDTQIKTLKEALDLQTKELGELKTKFNAQPDYSRAVITGIAPDSAGYSVMKMGAYSAGRLQQTPPAYEIDVHNKLAEVYKAAGWKPTDIRGCRTYLIPFSTGMIPRESSEGERLAVELKQKMIVGADKVDRDEVEWLQKKIYGHVQKDLSTFNDAAGGVLLGFPTLGELIDVQRNVEVFANAGATEQSLPPNGMIQFPKLTNVSSAFWIGEGASITESTPATGYLELKAKKLGIRIDLNNELIRFASISSEAMVRTDMAKVAALKMDLAQLEGTGGTQIKGLITYPSASSWTTGTDPLLTFAVTSNLLQVSNAADMEAIMPDTAGEPTAWVMRRDLFAKIRNRRGADAVTVTDAKGPYLINITRDLSERIPLQWDGTKVVRSTQVSNTRGAGSNTYVILGYFPDWITARFGVLEFLSTMVSDQAFQNDQTQIRCIQHVDAGPRHASSFVFADDISVA